MKFFQKQAIGAVVAMAFLGLTPLAASAHDEVVSTSPVANSTVDAGVTTVSVTFNEDIMKNPDLSGEVIQVVDANNDVLTLDGGCLTVDGPSLSTKIDVQQAGEYTVNWRSVSNDGHPSEGSFKFSVADSGSNGTTGPTAAADGACAATYSAIDSTSEGVSSPVAVDATAPTPSAIADPFITNLPFLGAGVVLVVLGALAGPLMQKLRTKREAERAALKQLEDEEH